MSELLTAAQMRALESAAIARGEVTSLELMERAGRGVVEAIFEEWPELRVTSHRAVVLCGPGNNGGDGFVVARLLKEWGWEVEVFLYGEAEKLPSDARVNYERWREIGAVQRYCDDSFSLDPKIWDTQTLLIDALFGTGLVRPLEGLEEIGWVTQISEWFISPGFRRKAFPGCRVVAVDVPSGFDADSGEYLYVSDPWHEEIRADLTVTFHARKLGHVLADGSTSCGRVVVKSIGLDEGPAAKREVVRLVERPSHWTRKTQGNNKYSHGHALILSGPSGQTGAARLAARGALRIGAGLVTVGAPTDAMAEHAAQLNAIMLKRLEGADALADALLDARINALCLGPALGLGAETRDLVAVALKSGRKCVLDADGLSIFENKEEELFALCHEGVVLTPHGGEFQRLFPDIHTKLQAPATRGPAYSKVDATREAAARAGCVVLFKGPDTVIAAPDGRCSVHAAAYERAVPWLATAGAGDVLAGFIAGLLARGFSPMEAAESAAWLHVECARTFGPGLIAEDLPEMLPTVFRKLSATDPISGA